MNFENICVIGLGYIGLPTAAIIAARRKHVIGVDINENTINTINQGQIHIVEPELDIIVHSVVHEKYLRATTKPEPADAFIITVPTPFTDNYQPDLSYIHSAVKNIAPVLQAGNLIVLESTSPVGTTAQIATWLSELRPDLTFPKAHHETNHDHLVHIAHCPERVLPGHIVREIVANDRIIGGITPTCTQLAVELYKIFVEGKCFTTDAATAEMTKLVENAYRDVNIAFANELSILCESLNINVWKLIQLANHHPRVNILQPGPGVGGHCIAVDPWFIIAQNPEHAKLIRTARAINDIKPQQVLDKIKLAIAEHLQHHTHKTASDVMIACFGLTFKANIDDLRESPALAITEALTQIHPSPILIVEPHLEGLPSSLEGKATFTDCDTALSKADICILLVDHDEFKDISQTELAHKKIIDTRGIWVG